MNIRYLAQWVEEDRLKKSVVHQIRKYRDQIAISFRKQKTFLQINLGTNGFLFFTGKEELLFNISKELELLNQRLQHAILKRIELLNQDRIVELVFDKKDITGQLVSFFLIIELIPNRSNLILTDRERKILFSLRSSRRFKNLLPGSSYHLPSKKEDLCLERIVYPISFDQQGKIRENTKKFNIFPDMNSFFEGYYYLYLLPLAKKKLIANQEKILRKEILKKHKKLDKLSQELSQTRKENHWKQIAELLKANFSKMKRGMKLVRLKNYYQNGFPEIEIELEPNKTPSENIENYFKKYRKARDGKVKIKQQIEKTGKEIRKLESKLTEQRSWKDLDEESENLKSAKPEPKRFRMLKINQDWEVYIGRNNKENDLLLSKLAKPHDWWFHCRMFHGSHLILRNLNKNLKVPSKIILICARMAAYYSKAKHATNVPVDYTQVRYVRKPRGASAGFVTYTNQKTLYVDPAGIRDIRSLI